MSFNILDYIDKLTVNKEYVTWVDAVCPVCQGRLKISKSGKVGAYSCYTSECSAQKIREKVSPSNSFRNYRGFSNSASTPVKRLCTVVQSIPLHSFDVSDLFSDEVYTELEVHKHGNDTYTYYYYSPSFRMVRLDKYETKSKVVYPQSFEKGSWHNTRPLSFSSPPIYKLKYCSKSVIMVEGEKAADAGQKLGLKTITYPSFASNSEYYLNKLSLDLKNQGVTRVVYLRDNDKPGLEKAKKACVYLHNVGLSAGYINLAEHSKYTSTSPGYDLYDYLTSHSVEELLGYITESIG